MTIGDYNGQLCPFYIFGGKCSCRQCEHSEGYMGADYCRVAYRYRNYSEHECIEAALNYIPEVEEIKELIEEVEVIEEIKEENNERTEELVRIDWTQREPSYKPDVEGFLDNGSHFGHRLKRSDVIVHYQGVHQGSC